MLILFRILLVLIVVLAIVIEKRRFSALSPMTLLPSQAILVGLAALNIGFVLFLWVNHIGFPLNLDLMEGTVLEHFRRALHGLPVYPAPTPDYVPFAYNPLYYFLSVPFAWVLGDGLAHAPIRLHPWNGNNRPRHLPGGQKNHRLRYVGLSRIRSLCRSIYGHGRIS